MPGTRTVVKPGPRPEVQDPAPKPSGRIILLSGAWQSFKQAYQFEATIFVTPEGGANGDILWITVYSEFSPPGSTGSEFVRGLAHGIHLTIEGYYADPLLACDQYSIMLCGSPKAGPFVGTSVTFGRGGEMSGTYNVVEQRD
jgi:hypothetical protein